jgi:subtilisin family serine protease
MKQFPRYIAIMLLVLATSVSAQASSTGRLSVWLQNTIRHNRQTFAKTGKTTQSGHRADAADMLTTVFVQMQDGINDEMLAQYGCKKYAQLGDIAIVTIPLYNVDALSMQPEVLRIEANDKGHPTLDLVPGITNLLPVYEQTAQHPAFTGQGVVVGIMDIGFDLTHPTFYNDASLSNYRIKAFWDQLAPNTDKDHFPVGSAWTTPEEVLQRQCAIDGREQNHGTHTTGIAVGSGYDSPYRGAAWESDLCLVANAVTADTAFIDESDYYLYTSASDALGFKYLFDYADSQHKPCVVSFSEGYTPYMDQDDRLYSLFLERLVGPGRILVSSAGNECQEMTYFNKPPGIESAGSFIRVYHPAANYKILSDGKPVFKLMAYQEKNVVAKELRLPLDNENWQDDWLVDTLFVQDDTCAVSVTKWQEAFSEGKTVYMIRLKANRSLDLLGHIAMVVEGSTCQAEVFGTSTYSFGNYSTDTRWNAAEKSHNVLAPGCFDAAITVGSTSHRVSYTNIDGEVITDTRDPEAGRLSWFSSVGPTMDGRTKPDVTAPGNYVISSQSSFYLEEHPDETKYDVNHFDFGGRTYVWAAQSGTSMSTPVVAGIIALWLQANPTLSPDDIRGILQRTCQHPDPQLSYPNNLYGFGEVDAYRGLLDILGISGIKELSDHQPGGVRVTARDGLLHLQFAQEPTERVLLSIYATSGTLLHRQWLTPTSRDVSLSLPVTASGIYAIQLTSKDKTLTGSQLIRL